MHVDLKVTTVNEYANYLGKEIDYEEREPEYFKKPENSNTISAKEADALQCVISCEVSIYLLRRSTGHCGSVVDNMVQIRRFFINEYEKMFAKRYEDINGEDIY
jgi:hypothetical protein